MTEKMMYVEMLNSSYEEACKIALPVINVRRDIKIVIFDIKTGKRTVRVNSLIK